MIKILLSLICVFAAFSSFAQTRQSKLKPLYFPADKNKLQILPQRFEYSLLDEDRLQVGDILFDTTQVVFQIEPSTEIKGSYRIQFRWPAGIIREGQLAIKTSSGKAIFNQPIAKGALKISHGPTDNLQEGLRADIATFSVDGIEAGLLEDMKYFPFMTFCIYRESEGTRLYLCSKELYLTTQDGKMVIKPRTTVQKTAQIEINGKIVGNRGIIYLNDRTEGVAFKMQTQTGAFLEIETRMKDVDIKDVVVAEDNENIILTASGAKPADESKVKKISDTEWQISLPKDRPVLYLKGDCDIPMRQEFYIRGTLPRSKNRSYLFSISPSRTYNSKITFNGVTPDGVQIKIPADDPNSEIELIKKNQFKWTLRNIPAGQESRHYLTVVADNKEFVAGYDIYRGQPFRFEMNAYYQTPSGILFGSFSFQWWLENFLYASSDWSRFHWGVSLEREQHLTEKQNIAKIDFTTLELLWRAKEGFNFQGESWGLSLPLQMIQSEGASATAFGLGAFWVQQPSNWLKRYMHWSELKMQYLGSSSGGDLKVKSGLRLKASAFWQLNTQWYFHYGLNFSDDKYAPMAGLLYKF